MLYTGDYTITTQLYRDYFISHSKDPVINQPGFQWNVVPGFGSVHVAQLTFLDFQG